ncbi:MAG: dihydropteroate synthase [Woeseiaceae bacterium]|nr:dihydropteroate synthase [Woeseiaceae bacterium]
MGVLNVTPDSFSDGGRFADHDAALRQAESMAAGGAQIIDVGGESTRPGAQAVSEQQELDRVLPVIEGIREILDVPVSVDTSKPAVMRAAVAAGAVLVNDVFALRLPGALEAVADLGCPACLMHMQGKPRTMQDDPRYDDVVADVTAFLEARVAECVAAGIERDHLIVDPGFGFGKRPEHNVRLLAGLPALCRIGCPVLIGVSRKATLGHLTGRDVEDRLPASIAAAVLAVTQGAQIVRAHDVGATVDALRIARAVMDQEGRA